MYVSLHVKGLLVLSLLSTKVEFSRRISIQASNIKFHENSSSRSPVVSSRQADRRIDMTELAVALRNFANAPKKYGILVHTHEHILWHDGLHFLVSGQCVVKRVLICTLLIIFASAHLIMMHKIVNIRRESWMIPLKIIVCLFMYANVWACHKIFS